MLLSLMPVEETGERGLALNVQMSMFPHAYKLKNKFQLEEKDIGIIFLWEFRYRCSSRLHKIS